MSKKTLLPVIEDIGKNTAPRFEYVADDLMYNYLVDDDRLFDYPFHDVDQLLKDWKAKYANPKSPHCVVIGCPWKRIDSLRKSDAPIFCYEHDNIHERNVIRIYKNAEQSISRILDSLMRSDSGLTINGNTRGAWLSETELYELKSDYRLTTSTGKRGRPILYSLYEDKIHSLITDEMMSEGIKNASFLAKGKAERLYTQAIKVLARKSYFFRSINSFILGYETGHEKLVGNYMYILRPTPVPGEAMRARREEREKNDTIEMENKQRVEREREDPFSQKKQKTGDRRDNKSSSGNQRNDYDYDDDRDRYRNNNTNNPPRQSSDRRSNTPRKGNEDRSMDSYHYGLSLSYCSSCLSKEANFEDRDTSKLYCSYDCRTKENASESESE